MTILVIVCVFLLLLHVFSSTFGKGLSVGEDSLLFVMLFFIFYFEIPCVCPFFCFLFFSLIHESVSA